MPSLFGKGGQLSSGRAGVSGHCPGHFGGVAVGHAGDKVDDAHKRAM